MNQKFTEFINKFRGVPMTAKVFLLQNLSIMIKTGIPLAEALKTLSEQTGNKKLKTILTDVQQKIEKGKGLGESLELYENDFGELFINMVKAGEASGRLEEVFLNLYLQTKKEHAMIAKIRNALTYPVIILIAMFGIGAFMIFFVLPNITALFKDLDIELPITTRIMIAVSDFLQAYGIWVGLSLILIFIFFVRALRSQKGKFIFDQIVLKTPILAGIVKKINLARLARNLSSLLKTDIAIVDTLNITARVLGNTLYRRAMEEAAEQVKKGQKLETIFRNYPKIFPPVITQMVAVGESTGTLDEILEQLANFYEEDVEQTMDSLPSIIEPVLMLLIGVAVAGVALAIMMPMYSLTEKF